jgi:hypothetical protein
MFCPAEHAAIHPDTANEKKGKVQLDADATASVLTASPGKRS